MPTITVQKRTAAAIDATPNMTIWHTIKSYLEAKRDAIYEEISHYRAPIPACDVQFNHLLEERSRVFQELSRVNSLAAQSQSWDDPRPLVEEFLTTSTCLDAESKQHLRTVVVQMPTVQGT